VKEATRRQIKNSPAWVLRKSSCIADSALAPPNWDGYKFITTELGRAYGEEKDFMGVPYMKHIPLTGGLCAQAVCFMATVLLRRHAAGVYCIVDITALATGGLDSKRELELVGLKHKDLLNYFSHSNVNLNSIWQIPTPWSGGFVEGRIVTKERLKSYSTILRSYLLSDMPVIVTVDSGRLSGMASPARSLFYESVFKLNRLKREVNLADAFDLRRLNHAIILVGWGKECNGEQEEEFFVFNDPSTFPFMKAQAKHFFDAACYTDDSLKDLCEPWFLPVTPSEVLLPLGDWTEELTLGRDFDLRPGMIKIAQRFQAIPIGSPLPCFPKGRSYDPGEFRLVKFSDVLCSDIVASNEDLSKYKDWLASWQAEKIKVPELKENWCWLQVQRELYWKGEKVLSIWIWDAQKYPPDFEDVEKEGLEKYLIDVLVEHDGSLRSLKSGGETQDLEEDSDTETEEEGSSQDRTLILRKSLITSFSVQSIKESVRVWPKNVEFCDLYAFMEGDSNDLLHSWHIHAERLSKLMRYTVWVWLFNLGRLSPFHIYWSGGRPRLNRKPKKSLGIVMPIIHAREKMAWLWQKDDIIHKCAQKLNGSLGNIQALAIDSFLPGLSSSQDESAQKAQLALKFLIKLANELQDLDQPCRIIEIVAGSLFEGTWRGIRTGSNIHRKDRIVYVANIMSREQAINNFISNLKSISEFLNSTVKLAIELEPGPSFVLNTWESLQYLCKKLDDEANLSHVGLNLDVAHWTLAKITPEMVRNCKEVKKRIFHGHISDHSNGHFSDVGLGLIHKRQHFKAWLDLLHEVAEDQKKLQLGFWGGVAIELEACKTMKSVHDSVKILNDLVADPLIEKPKKRALTKRKGTSIVGIRRPGKGKGHRREDKPAKSD
jgi:sugar phosphate isomerase/epimerase